MGIDILRLFEACVPGYIACLLSPPFPIVFVWKQASEILFAVLNMQFLPSTSGANRKWDEQNRNCHSVSSMCRIGRSWGDNSLQLYWSLVPQKCWPSACTKEKITESYLFIYNSIYIPLFNPKQVPKADHNVRKYNETINKSQILKHTLNPS